MKPIPFLTLVSLSLLTACGPLAAQPPEAPVTAPSSPVETQPPAGGPVPTEGPPTFTPSAEILAAPTLGIGSSQTSSSDGMHLLYVPEGPFLMGAEDGYSDEKPAHTVSLPAFWVDQTEVTNGQYALCVEAGVCSPPIRKTSNLVDYYYGFPEYVDYPVIFIAWQDAVDYCTWAGRRLPSEAEWEKAARGTDGAPYPWGSDYPQANMANFNYAVKDVVRVGGFPEWASPYGALDMAGNALEWTADWYDADYYAASPDFDPPGPETGTKRVARGGAWTSNELAIRATYRHLQSPDTPDFNLGFRCVMDAQP